MRTKQNAYVYAFLLIVFLYLFIEVARSFMPSPNTDFCREVIVPLHGDAFLGAATGDCGDVQNVAQQDRYLYPTGHVIVAHSVSRQIGGQ